MPSSACGAPRCAVLCCARSLQPILSHAQQTPQRRCKSTKPDENSSPTAATAALSPRWLSDVKRRIGQCITFGLKPHQTHEAGTILQEIARDWRELVAGSEGYLTGPTRRSMHRQEVVWGEMDSMVC